MTRTLTALVAAAILFVGLTGSARPFDFAQGEQATPLDFSPIERVVAEELKTTGTPGGAVAASSAIALFTHADLVSRTSKRTSQFVRKCCFASARPPRCSRPPRW